MRATLLPAIFAFCLIGCQEPNAPASLLVTVRVTPTSVVLMVGSSLQMHASSRQLPTATWLWQVNDTTRAEVSGTGVVFAKRMGTVLVQACATGQAACGNAVVIIAEPLVRAR